MLLRKKQSSLCKRSMAAALVILMMLTAGCNGGVNETRKEGLTSIDSSTVESGIHEGNSNEDTQSSNDGSNIKGGSSRMAQPKDDISHLPAGTNPMAQKEDPQADSGVKGTLYYVKAQAMLQKLGTNTKLQYDALKFAACLQGIMNREKPVIFIDFLKDIDTFWYSYLRQKDKLLHGYKQEEVTGIHDLLGIFKDQILKQGVVVWDSAVPATSNVASTICGVDGYLPVRYDEEESSLYNILVNKWSVPVKVDLTGKFTGKGTIPDTDRKSTGSSKCDAYLWAMEKYLNKTNELVMAYFVDAASWEKNRVVYPDLDNAFVPNHDYAIAKNAFVFDLSPWNDEKPCDDLNQPMGTDYKTFKEILQRQYDRSQGKKIIQVLGFIPWQIKYTTHLQKGKHEPVPTEWKYAEILSAYNCVMDAEAAGFCGLSNASLYMHYPLKDKYTNSKPKLIPEYDASKKYVYIYMGDYDASAWLTRFAPKLWNDPARGKIPLSWAFNPNLSDRVPMVFDYLYENKTDNDYFIAGDSGAGYLNPTLLLPPRIHSNNPSGMEAWVEHNKYYFNKFDISITGFLIDGVHTTKEPVMEAYSQFSQGGVCSLTLNRDKLIYNGTPFKLMNHGGIGAQDNSVEEATKIILGDVSSRKSGVNFLAYRTILCTPGFINTVMERVKAQNKMVEFVDAYTYFDLIKQAEIK